MNRLDLLINLQLAANIPVVNAGQSAWSSLVKPILAWQVPTGARVLNPRMSEWRWNWQMQRCSGRDT